MNRIVLLSACLLLALLLLLGFRAWISDHVSIIAANIESGRTRLTRAQVLGIAKAKAQMTDAEFSHYEAPAIDHKNNGNAVVWSVFYRNKSHGIGSCFWVEVDDRTGAGRLFPCG
jgi:hypothetical protein